MVAPIYKFNNKNTSDNMFTLNKMINSPNVVGSFLTPTQTDIYIYICMYLFIYAIKCSDATIQVQMLYIIEGPPYMYITTNY